MIRTETVSDPEKGNGPENFERFRSLLKELFPDITGKCEVKEFNGSLLMKWKGQDSKKHPVMFMNHYDVVPAAPDGWKHPPFSGDIAEGKIWGRGTLDDKGGLWAMLRAADELVFEGFVPSRDIYLETTCNEECFGVGADEISAWMLENGIRLDMVFDEGGDILYEPVKGAEGLFAMMGVGEKSIANLRFIARSEGGHSSSPGKNTPLVRLGKFMSYVDRHNVFETELTPTTEEMFRRLSPYMGRRGKLLAEPKKHKKMLESVLSRISPSTKSVMATTIAFTMTGGGEAPNVIPKEAWVLGDMRCSHHQGKADSIKAITKIAEKFDLEVEIVKESPESGLSDYKGEAFRLAEEAVRAVFPDVNECVPFITATASDARFYSRVCDQCIRFLPFRITEEQKNSIHGLNECLDLDTLIPAVDYYRYMLQHV